MPDFLTSLLVLVSGFILGGAPIDIPPYLNEALQTRGIQVSSLAKDFNSFSPTPTPAISHLQNENNNDQKSVSQDEKIPAYNTSSDKEMPTNLPQNAVDNSPALDPSPYVKPTCTPPPACMYSHPRCLMPTTEDMCPPPPEPSLTPDPNPTTPPEPTTIPESPCHPYDDPPGKYAPERPDVCIY